MNATLRNLLMAAVLVMLLAPLVVVAGVSVNEKKELLFPPHGFSLAWYPVSKASVRCCSICKGVRSREASRSTAAGSRTSSTLTPSAAQVAITHSMYSRWLPVTPSSGNTTVR